MSFFIGLLAWLLIGAVLVAGIVMAAKGTLLLLVVGLAAFIFAFAKWGCATH
jgi:hypothetical protein